MCKPNIRRTLAHQTRQKYQILLDNNLSGAGGLYARLGPLTNT